MKLISPIVSTTEVFDKHTWKPKNFNTFFEEITNIHNNNENSFFIYRGHQSSDWKLDSTFVRSFKREILHIPESAYINDYIRNSEEFNNVISWFYLFKFGILLRPSNELEDAHEKLGIDQWFELLKRMQQFPEEDHPEINGTNILDWTKSIDVALYFANDDRNNDGALWLCDATATGKTLQTIPVGQILDMMKDSLKNDKAWGTPLLFYPPKQIDYIRAKNQDVIYVAQMDLRFSLDELWSILEKEKNNELIYMKLILPVGSQSDFRDYLISKGKTSNFIFPISN